MAKSILLSVSLAVRIQVDDDFDGNPSAGHLSFQVTPCDGLDQQVTVTSSSVVDDFIVEDERDQEEEE